MIVKQSNLYDQQNDKIFQIKEEEIKVFLESNFMMIFNKLPTIASYWEWREDIE